MTNQEKYRLKHIAVASFILAVAFAVITAVNSGYITVEAGEISKRMMGILFGVLLVVFSNSAPKRLTPLSGSTGDPARRQSLQRFAGWAFVLSGIGYSAIWLAAPIHAAAPLSISLVGSALVVVFFRCVLLRIRRD